MTTRPLVPNKYKGRTINKKILNCTNFHAYRDLKLKCIYHLLIFITSVLPQGKRESMLDDIE
jgi:hypothetical protein